MPSEPENKAPNLSDVSFPKVESKIESDQIKQLQRAFGAKSSTLTKQQFRKLLADIHNVIREEAGGMEDIHGSE